jgi:hypothetical protein
MAGIGHGHEVAQVFEFDVSHKWDLSESSHQSTELSSD